MEKESKIYIAGHKGLVGSSLMKRLQLEGFKNIVTRTHAQLDLTRQSKVEKFFEEEKPEYVFLAAAKVGGILANIIYKAEFIYDNIMIAANVIHSAYKYGTKKLLNLGSSCIYPKFAPQPMEENHLLSGSLEPTNEPYAISKIASFKLCRYYNEQFGTNFISVMPANLYGLNDNFNLETSHVLSALIRKFHLAKLLKNKDYEGIKRNVQKYPLGFELDKKLNPENEKSTKHELKNLGITEDYVLIWGNGESLREFLYVDDLANACLFLMNNYDSKNIGEFINVGTGKDITINELAKLVKEIIGFEGEIRHDLSKPTGTPRKLLNISKIKSLGWEPKTTLEEGIKKTYKGYLGS